MGVLAWSAFVILVAAFTARVIYSSIAIIKDQNERVKEKQSNGRHEEHGAAAAASGNKGIEGNNGKSNNQQEKKDI